MSRGLDYEQLGSNSTCLVSVNQELTLKLWPIHLKAPKLHYEDHVAPVSDKDSIRESRIDSSGCSEQTETAAKFKPIPQP